MSAEAIGAIAAAAVQVPSLAPSQVPGAAVAGAPGGFGSLVTEGLGEVNSQLMTSQADLQLLAAGDAGSLHEVMLRLEQSRMSFELLMQVRGRLLEAYQDVMRMQV